eukprot:554733-Prymnesium_polylepis.1
MEFLSGTVKADNSRNMKRGREKQKDAAVPFIPRAARRVNRRASGPIAKGQADTDSSQCCQENDPNQIKGRVCRIDERRALL